MTLKMLDTFAGIGGFSYAAKYLVDQGIETGTMIFNSADGTITLTGL